MRLLLSVFVSLISLLTGMQLAAQSLYMQGTLKAPLPVDADTMSSSGWTEDPSQRTIHSAFWKHDDGRIRVEHSKQPIHYKQEDGSLKRISQKLSETSDGWVALDQPYPIQVSANGDVIINAGNKNAISFSGAGKFNQQNIGGTCSLHSFNFIVKNEVVPNVDKEFIFYENSFKSQFKLFQPIFGNAESLIVEEEIVIPENSRLIADESHGSWVNDRWSGRMLIQNSSGNVIGTIGSAICYDDANNYFAASYSWTQHDNRITLNTHVPYSWLNDPERIYPIVIDPLITGPLAEFGPNFMPSCYIPEYHADSLLITVPGQITVTGFFVTTSFTCDPPAVKGDGAMYFSTTCATSGTFTVAPPEDAIPGIAYLENFDFRNPLMCCYEPSCTETSFYLRMHLGRFTPEGDCDDYNLVYYNPTSPWPFKAFIEGHTVETYGSEWTVSSLPICSNECITEGRIRMKFGVPPYTLTHPWMTGSVVVETPTPCDLSNKYEDLPLNVPGCPLYCPDFFNMDVPPATVTDACGNTIPNLPSDILNIKPAPDVAQPDVFLCSNTGYELLPLSCEDESLIHWAGNGQGGTGPIIVQLDNPGGGVFDYAFLCSAEVNDCFSDTVEFIVHILPDPQVNFTIIPEPAMVNVPVYFDDESTSTGSAIEGWYWEVDGINGQSGYQTDYTINTPGTHEVCLQVTNDAGCIATLCKNFEVTLNTIIAPNIFTPNGDGSNDFLVFRYLEFFPENHLTVFNRWGNIVYETKNYANNWNGGDVSDGTYYYVLNMAYSEGISGYIQVIRN